MVKNAMTPKLGISVRSLSRDASDIDLRISEVAEYRPDSIELMCFAQDLILDGKVLTSRAERIRQSLDHHSIVATMHGPISLNLLDSPDNLDRHLGVGLAYIDLGVVLGITAMVIHTGYCSETDQTVLRSRYAAQRDGLKRLADYAGRHGIMIYVENIFPFFEGAHTALPGQLAEEILVVDHPQLLGCFDVSHAYIACTAYGADLPHEAKQISPVAPHWHVHDSFGRPNTGLNPYTKSECLAYGMGDLHLAVGDGDLPWSSVLNSAPPISGSTFNIELNPDLWSDMPQCVTATRQLISDAARLKAA
jgi:sugar phosphate isomerase/epimerase